uniref:Carboxylesterase 5 n=1 Tax=Meteorus pulchricornis TaxID=51522 RepID=A0A4D6J8G7_9HYME|nr:carboxylesterase 5 [Meteorus pulchricornis]
MLLKFKQKFSIVPVIPLTKCWNVFILNQLKNMPAHFQKSLHELGIQFYSGRHLLNKNIMVTKKNQQPYLTTPPLDLFRSRIGNFVPLIIGSTTGEFAGSAIAAEELAQKGNNSGYDKLNNEWEELAPIYVGYERGTPKSRYISRELRKFYLNDEPVGLGRYQGLANLWADTLHFQAHFYDRLMATYSCQPIYHYLFGYQGCESWSKWSNGTIFGVGHQDELLLLFKVGQFPEVCDRDIKTLERLTGIVESFAKTGRPIPADNHDYSNVNWETTTKDDPKYLKIDEELSMVNGIIYEDRMNKWDELFPLPSIKITN